MESDMNKKHLLAAILATLSLNTFAAASDSAAADKEAAPSQWHIIGETENRGLRYLYIEMPRPKNRTGFIAQVGEIHAAEPDAWLIILDDDEKIAEVLADNSSGDMSRFPAAWMKEHLLGTTALMLDPKTGARQWVLHEGAARSDSIATLACIEGKGGCTQ